MNGQVTYNGSSLNTYVPGTRTGIFTTDIKHISLPEKTTAVYPLADTNGNVASNPTYPSKIITITGGIAGSSLNDLDSRIDSFKAIFNSDKKNLDINYGGGSRRYVAVLDDVPAVYLERGLCATFTVTFICQPFGSDTSLTTLFSVANNTTGAYNGTPTILGNAPIQLPIFTITLDALTGTGDFIQLSNDLNGQTTLLYNKGLVAGDVVIFNSITRKTTINAAETDILGSYITLDPGASSITYGDGFTTRQVDILAEYYKQYL